MDKFRSDGAVFKRSIAFRIIFLFGMLKMRAGYVIRLIILAVLAEQRRKFFFGMSLVAENMRLCT